MKNLKFEKIDSAKFTELAEMTNIIGGVGPTYAQKATKGTDSCADTQLYTYNLSPTQLAGPDGPAVSAC